MIAAGGGRESGCLSRQAFLLFCSSFSPPGEGISAGEKATEFKVAPMST